MKSLVLISAFFFLHLICIGQNWEPFPLNQKTWFEFNSEDHQSISVYYTDSLVANGNSNFYYFNLKYLSEALDIGSGNYRRNCLDSLWALDYIEDKTVDFISFKEPLVENNGNYIFKGKTVFNSHLQSGESIMIELPDSSNFDQLRIECTEKKLGNVFGKIDSLKVFSIKAFINSQQVNSIYDSFEYILSKKYGFVEFLPFEELLTTPKTNATLYNFEDSEELLCGGPDYNSSHNFPYKVGDVITYIEEAKSYRGTYYGDGLAYHRDSIISIEDNLRYIANGTSILFGYYFDYNPETADTVKFTGKLKQIRSSSTRNNYFDKGIYGLDFEIIFHSSIGLNDLRPDSFPFSFIPNQNSYNILYNTGPGINYECEYDYSPLYYFSERRLTNNELGQLSYWSGSEGGFVENWDLISFERKGRTYTPCANLDSVYYTNSEPVNLVNDYFHNSNIVRVEGIGIENKIFNPQLVPNSLLNSSIEITCEIFPWSETQTIVVREGSPPNIPLSGSFNCIE